MVNPVCPVVASGEIERFLIGLMCYTFDEYGFYYSIGVSLAFAGMTVSGDDSPSEDLSIVSALLIAPVLFILIVFAVIPLTGALFEYLRQITPIPWDLEFYRIISMVFPVVYLIVTGALATNRLTGRIET